ncbi:hypothetical protein [Pseudomonas yamanorum]|uniref:hypothetical protein n=1 Tax=Pseudomonas yamanorum TaxID=515393 RepID=UPI00087BA285|nr:hypothetical protein [Pseudomonas yamanorum]SDT94017.1 hypothetical protein SAMN05216237_0566 [Pseudomonas yamanorum]
MDKSIPGGQEFEIPGFDPPPPGLPSTLRRPWDEALRKFQGAENNMAHTFALGYAMGMATGWLRAGLINLATYEELSTTPLLGKDWGQQPQVAQP